LAIDPDTAISQLDELGRAGSNALLRRQKIIRFLIKERGPTEVAWIYAQSGGNAQDLKLLATRGLIVLGESEVIRDPLANLAYDPSEPPPLTSDQTKAWNQIHPSLNGGNGFDNGQTFLLHGVTGSGKTEIYLRAVAETLKNGGRAIVLVPEISLTPQTVRRFMGRFPDQVGLIHSRLSQGERYDTWRRARSGDLSVIVGPRSALFTPLPDLRLIIVDESHDTSYYQSENPPFYNAREVAVEYAQLLGAVCILGSATPDVNSTHRAEQGEWQLVKLPERILAHRETVRAQMVKHGGNSGYKPLDELAEFIDLPPVQIIDMRDELKSGNRSIFSRSMQAVLSEVLKQGQQAILFLNRRGVATYVFCRDCGYALKCPQCDTPLTFHGSTLALTCHHCGYQRKKPDICPQCQGTRIRQYGMGTERVESDLLNMFPSVRTLRWDWDTTRKKGAHDVILSSFSEHQADVLIGTQMLAKGLDLPLVTLVGVILADVGLHLPDYRSSERVFQILTQVSGRAGRSPLGGQVILQTFHPDNYVIQSASQHDYESFYRREMIFRREAEYPPFSKVVRFEYRHRDPEAAETNAAKFASTLRQWLDAEGARMTQLIGPVPCFYTRLRGEYRWQIVLKGPDPAKHLEGRDFGEWRVEVDPQALL
jgi:primosomal protein N' (replication factor Y)